MIFHQKHHPWGILSMIFASRHVVASGLAVGASVGAMAGSVTGGAAGYQAYAKREQRLGRRWVPRKK